jgi:dipeptidyl aminopeptidase/acylaminoacyl peptidase
VTEPKIASFGSWESPITSDLIVTESIGLTQPMLDGPDIYWSEMRPSEGGRYVIMRRDESGATEEINPPPLNARTRVHEYGGGSYLVHRRQIYFSNFADQRIYRQAGDDQPRPITPEAQMRYADGLIVESQAQLICVREDHTAPGQEAVNSIVRIRLDGEPDCGDILISGNDFYSSPRLNPEGNRLAWLTWNHPNMPWDGCELWVGELQSDGTLRNSERLVGGLKESIFQPEWSPDGVLYFVSDRSGWWNLCRFNAAGVVEVVHAMEAEFAMPQWIFGMSSYAFESAGRIVCSYIQKGISHLALIDTRTGVFTPLNSDYTDIQFLRASPGQAVFRAGSPAGPSAIIRLHLATMEFEVLRRAMSIELNKRYLSTPEPIEFPTEGGRTSHGLFYAPRNDDCRAPDRELPPLLVLSHGGPTSATSSALSLSIQYFTSRGIAVLDVNYGGSSGYGREYRERLKGNWGVVDVDDCANGALYLVRRGSVDGERLMISGGSAGGYTTLCALVFRDTFKAGASHYGVSDVEALAKDTHKFESRYLDGMIGPYPECRGLYLERSPLHFTDRLSCPLIFFQGLEDKVVPPSQAEAMVEALRSKGLPVAYVAFPGEQHGFRQAQNIKRALDGELYFYSRVFGFKLADEVEPVEIENLT